MKKVFYSVGFSILVALLFFFLYYPAGKSAGAWIHFLERKALDIGFTRFSSVVKPDPDIVILAINDKVLQEMEPTLGRWPWPRRVMGEIVDYLHQVGVQGIGIDILYPERDLKDPQGDLFFAAKIKEAGNVSLAADFPEPIFGRTDRFPLFPFDDLLKVARAIGGVHLFADPDGPTRRYRLVYTDHDHSYPGLALSLLPSETAKAILKEAPLLPDGTYLLRWYGPQGTFRYIEAHKILQARKEFLSGGGALHQQASSFLKDKRVLVGVTATGLFDLRVTPFSPVYPGVEVHATALSNLKNSQFLYQPSPGMVVLYVVLVAILAGLIGALLENPFLETSLMILLTLMNGLVGLIALKTYSFWVPVALPALAVFIISASHLSWNYFVTGRDKRFIREAFAKYINEEVLSELLKNPEKLKLGGENVPLTILFSDIRGFTSLSENLKPDEVVSLLNEYLTAMVDIVFAHGGTLDKFIGDAVMAFWGAPVKRSDHAERAVQTGLAMLKKVEEIREKWQKEGKPSIRIGIGINTGLVTVGNIGSARSQSYTVIGDEVNLASRLESLNKEMKTEMIISESTLSTLRDKIKYRPLGEVKVKGKEKMVNIYEVIF